MDGKYSTVAPICSYTKKIGIIKTRAEFILKHILNRHRSKKKEFPIEMHAEEDCPQRERFIQEFLVLENERINSWKAYRVTGEGFKICSRILPMNFKTLEQRLIEEFNRLRLLEDSIEQTLQTVNG